MEFKTAWKNLIDKLINWFNELVLLIPNILLAALVMGVAALLSRYLSRYTNQFIYRITSNKTISNVASNIAVAAFILVMLFVSLGILNLDKALTSLLAGAGVVGLAVGLALQEPLVNLFSGVLMSVRRMYNVGDLVKTNDFFGTIEEISLRATILSLPTGEQVTLPNKEVLQNPLVNYTVSGKRKVVLDCGVGYDSDLDLVERLSHDIVSEICNCPKSDIDFFYTEFGNSSINFRLRFFSDDINQKHFLQLKSILIKSMKKRFDAHNIDIPFPIRTLNIPQKQLEILSNREASYSSAYS